LRSPTKLLTEYDRRNFLALPNHRPIQACGLAWEAEANGQENHATDGKSVVGTTISIGGA
jgi:hypothetical protein